jgi:hypothetical protein
MSNREFLTPAQKVAISREHLIDGVPVSALVDKHKIHTIEFYQRRKWIQFAKQFMHEAVDWKIIDENPFSKVRTQRSTVKVNEFVPREVVDKLMKKANSVWKVILGLSRYGGLRTPSETLSPHKVVGTFHVPFRRFNQLHIDTWLTAQRSVPATLDPAYRVGHDCSIRCVPAGKRNCSESSRCTWSAPGLATHHASLSRVIC